MSDLLNLATDLKSREDDELVSLLLRRGVSGAPKDFFDLAQSLLSQKSLALALSTLTWGEADQLQALLDDDEVAANLYTDALRDRGLVFQTASGLRVLDAIRAQLEESSMVFESRLEATMENIRAGFTPPDTDSLGQAAIAAFQTQQGIVEILLDAEQNQIKHMGKTGFGVSDVKRLAGHLNLELTQVRGLYQLAAQLNLVQMIGQNWWLTPAARAFVAATMSERWQILAQQWVLALGPLGPQSLAAVLTSQEYPTVRDKLLAIFPLRDQAVLEQLELLAQQAEALGFAVGGRATALLTYTLMGQAKTAVELLQRELPGLQHSLIVQADLSLIAPGPLDSATEATLRLFADIEQVSVANTYRISAQSISRGLESGLSIDAIRSALTELNRRPLPQPVEYLLTDTHAKFAQIKIFVGPGGAEKSILQASDALLLTRVLNDSRLRAFAFKAPNASSISTRFEPEVVYQALREQGYLPVLADPSGAVIPPRRIVGAVAGLADSSVNPMQTLINNLREADRRVGTQPEDQDITRQIQMAIKNKVALIVVAADRAGAEVEFKLLPTAVANGRLRGMDKQSDVERTLPLERIVRVELG